jgi:hypothetical protein
VIGFVRGLPAWAADHPWWSALIIIGGLVAFTSLILLNPEGRQVRELWRKK